MKIIVKKLTDTAKMPTRGSISAAGYDLYADLETPVEIMPHETVMVGTGLSMEIPEGYFGAIFARSGLAAKESLRPANCVGVVDAGRRRLWKHRKDLRLTWGAGRSGCSIRYLVPQTV